MKTLRYKKQRRNRLVSSPHNLKQKVVPGERELLCDVVLCPESGQLRRIMGLSDLRDFVDKNSYMGGRKIKGLKLETTNKVNYLYIFYSERNIEQHLEEEKGKLQYF